MKKDSLRNLNEIYEFVTATFKEMILSESDQNMMSDSMLVKEDMKKKNLNEYFKNCYHGDLKDKLFAKQYISANILKDIITEGNIDTYLEFRPEKISGELAFKVLLFYYEKEFEKLALTTLIYRHGLNEYRTDEYGEKQKFVTSEDMIKIYISEDCFSRLTFKDKYEIILQIIYENTYGISVIDSITFQGVDEISCGTVGLPNDMIPKSKLLEKVRVRKAYETVNVKISGSQIKFTCIAFKSWNEFIDVCTKLSSYEAKKPLNKTDADRLGYRKDGSRVVVIRPPLGESWAFWLRLFPHEDVSNEDLIKFNGANDVGNTEELIRIERLIAKTTSLSICGAQGSGKTSKLKCIVEYYYPFKELRVLESILEAWLRNKHPGRDIYAMNETRDGEGRGLSIEEVYDLSMRTSGLITIFTELRSNKMRVKVIEASNRGSEYNQFTSHENDPMKVPDSLAQSFLAERIYDNKESALKVIIDAVPVAIEVKVDPLSGFRYYNMYEFRLVEPMISDDFKYKEGLKDKCESMLTTVYDFFVRLTTKVSYEAVPIIIYDKDKNAYVKKNNISDELFKKIESRLIFPEEKKELHEVFKGCDDVC